MTRQLMLALGGIALATVASGETLDEHWTLSIDESSSYESVSTLTQESADTILDEYATKEVHPVLEFRCSSGSEVTFRIDWRRFISSFNTEVGFRVDGGDATWLKLGVDRSNKITLSKAADDANKLIEMLGDGDVLNVEVAPYAEPSVFASFDVSAFPAALAKLESACS